MGLGVAFWILMILWLVFGIFRWTQKDYWLSGASLFLFILFLLIGWKTFGAPLHG